MRLAFGDLRRKTTEEQCHLFTVLKGTPSKGHVLPTRPFTVDVNLGHELSYCPSGFSTANLLSPPSDLSLSVLFSLEGSHAFILQVQKLRHRDVK